MNRFKGENLFGNKDYLMSLFKTLKNFPKFDKEGYFSHSSLASTKRLLRKEIKFNTRVDYLSNDGGYRFGNMFYNTTRYNNFLRNCWPASIKEALLTGNVFVLKSKSEYYFVDNKFYDKADCFFIDDKIYDRKEYYESEGKALSKKEYFAAYSYGWKDFGLEQKYIKRNDVEVMRNKDWNEYNIQISFTSGRVSNRIFKEFITCHGKKVYENTFDHLNMTWEEAAGIDIKMPEEAIKVLSDFKSRNTTDRPSFVVHFKNCRKQSHKFLRALLGNKWYDAEYLPSAIKAIKEALAL